MKRSILVTALVVCLAHATSAQAAFPGSNGKIAFATDRDGNSEIYVMNADGSGQTRLTTGSELDTNPVWSPDGAKIAWERYTGGTNPDIWSMDANGANKTRLTTFGGTDMEPAWSPDGARIAFSSTRIGGDFEVYSMPAAGEAGGVTRLTTDSANPDLMPAWSPDGAKIAFVKGLTTNYELYTMNSDGSSPTNITNSPPSSETEPDWSPQGNRITFTLGPPGNPSLNEIWSMNPSGGGFSQLTTNNATDSTPAFSPSNSKIAFASDRDGNFEIYVMNPDGSSQTRVTNVAGGDNAPDWQPLGAFANYPRPGGATPLRVPLVPAFEGCTSPNSAHVAPLALPSCTPPAPSSSMLELSRIGNASGAARGGVVPGDPRTSADEADVSVYMQLGGPVYRTVGGDEFDGTVILETTLRLTDHANGAGTSGTVQDFQFGVPVHCGPLPGNPNQFACLITTTADALLPGMIKEGERMVTSVGTVEVKDPGPDEAVGAQCPPTCGTGDEAAFLRQGVFAP